MNLTSVYTCTASALRFVLFLSGLFHSTFLLCQFFSHFICIPTLRFLSWYHVIISHLYADHLKGCHSIGSILTILGQDSSNIKWAAAGRIPFSPRCWRWPCWPLDGPDWNWAELKLKRENDVAFEGRSGLSKGELLGLTTGAPGLIRGALGGSFGGTDLTSYI